MKPKSDRLGMVTLIIGSTEVLPHLDLLWFEVWCEVPFGILFVWLHSV